MTNPLIPDVKYATLITAGDGAKTEWEFNFAGGYISKDHVKAFTEDTVTGQIVIRTIEFVGPNTVRITPAVANGLRLVIYRDTPKTTPIVNYTDGSVMSETNLDKSNQQSVFIAAELADRVVADYDFSNALLYAVTTATEAKITADGIDAKASVALAESTAATVAVDEVSSRAQLLPVRPETFGGVQSAHIQAALNTGKKVQFTPGTTYNWDALVTYTGRVDIEATGSRHVGNGVVLRVIDGHGSRLNGGLYEIPADPFVITPNPDNWAATRTAADVHVGTDGYMPHPQDADIWDSLPDAVKNQPTGPKIEFTSSSASPTMGVVVTNVTGKYANFIFEGCTHSTFQTGDVVGGKDYAAVVFYNNTNIARISNSVMPYTFAQGVGNRVIDVEAHHSNVCGVVFFGNTHWYARNIRGYRNGESGFKLYQSDSTFPPSIISKYGIGIDITGEENRFDGVDAGATYPTSGTQSGFNTFVNTTARRNRATGLFSDAQSNSYIGVRSEDNGLGGATLQAAQVTIADAVFENNVKHPGILGAFPSYDLLLDGNGCVSRNVTVRRSSPPPYTYSVRHIGSSGSNTNTFSPAYPVSIDTTNLVEALATADRVVSVPTSYAVYYKTYETASIQTILRLGRVNSQGNVLDFRYGAGETACGNVSITETSTAYNTVSDYRLKMGDLPLEGMLDKLLRLMPKSWDWRSLGAGRQRGIGFYAHELAAEFPSAVTGMKDAVDADGNPVFQAVDTSVLIAPIVAALGELAARIKQLEGG